MSYLQCLGNLPTNSIFNYEVPLDNRRICIMKWDQEMTRKCYQDSKRIKKATSAVCVAPKPNPHKVKLVDLSP